MRKNRKWKNFAYIYANLEEIIPCIPRLKYSGIDVLINYAAGSTYPAHDISMNEADLDTYMDLLAENGLQACLQTFYAVEQKDWGTLNYYIQRYKDHPACWGFSGDEEGQQDIATRRTAYNYVKARTYKPFIECQTLMFYYTSNYSTGCHDIMFIEDYILTFEHVWGYEWALNAFVNNAANGIVPWKNILYNPQEPVVVIHATWAGINTPYYPKEAFVDFHRLMMQNNLNIVGTGFFLWYHHDLPHELYYYTQHDEVQVHRDGIYNQSRLMDRTNPFPTRFAKK